MVEEEKRLVEVRLKHQGVEMEVSINYDNLQLSDSIFRKLYELLNHTKMYTKFLLENMDDMIVHSEARKEFGVVVLSDSKEENGDELNIGSLATSTFVGSGNLGPGGSLMLNCQEVLPEGAQVDSSHIPFMLVHLDL